MKGILKFAVLLVCLIIATNLYNLYVQNENGRHSAIESDTFKDATFFTENIYYENGSIKEIWTYENDLSTATFQKSYRNGNLYSEGAVSNNEYHGIITYYYDDGNKESEWEFVEGVAHGSYIAFHKNGSVKTEANRHNGSYHGVMSHFDEEGHLEKKIVWEFGQVRRQVNVDILSGR